MGIRGHTHTQTHVYILTYSLTQIHVQGNLLGGMVRRTGIMKEREKERYIYKEKERELNPKPP